MKYFAVFLLLCSAAAFAQTYSDVALQNSSSNYARVVPHAVVTICQSTDTNVPCTNRITTYTDQTLTTPCTLISTISFGNSGGNGGPTSGTNCNNPGLADANGNFTIFAPVGLYRVCILSQNYLCLLKNISPGASVTATTLNNIRFADQFAGADCGAKINAANADLGASPGEIWVNQNCGALTTAVLATHPLRFIQGGVYTVGAMVTVSGSSVGIAGLGGSMSSGSTTGPVTILKEANGANLPAVVKMTGGGNWLEAIAVDGNKSNQTCPSPPCYGIWNFKAGRPALRNVSVQNAFSAGIAIESGTPPANESCCGDIIDMMSLNNGGSALKILNTSDTKITHAEFEQSNIGLELIDAPNTRIVNADFGGNTLQGLKSTCAAQFGASGIILSNSQFGNNGNADDLFIDAWNGTAQCLSGAANVITGNQFIGSASRAANTYDAIKIQNSKFNTVTGNNINTGASLFKIAVEFLSPNTTEGRDELVGNQLEGWGTTSCTLAAATNSLNNSLCANQFQNSLGFVEQAATTGAAGLDVCVGDSTAHALKCSYNNGPFLLSPQIVPTAFTTTAAATDNVTVTGMTATGHCALTPTNSGAAGGIASVFVSAKTTNQITVTHTATAGWTFDVMCFPQ